MSKEKLDTATDRLQGSKELREYKIEESSEQERVAEQKLISAAQNQYKAINDNYEKLSQEDKMKAIGRIEDYLKELLPIFAEDTEDIKKKMEELKDKIQIDLKENYKSRGVVNNGISNIKHFYS